MRELCLVATCFWLGCNDGGDAELESPNQVSFSADEMAVVQQAVNNYAAIVEASYADSLERAREMDTALAALVNAPSVTTLDAAKQAWLDSRVPYLQTEVYRFYDGPIDNPTDGPEGLLNAWPMDEAHVDYVVGSGGEVDHETGIINGYQPINETTLEEANEDGGEENVATGYHPIEFLLWGQDLSETGPGERPHTDYVVGAGASAFNQERRGQYLTTLSTLLQAHLTQVRDAWSADTTGNYREQFEGSDPLESFERLLTGMIVLGGFESAGERLQAALDTGDQEDEHSCFSDNTHNDMILNVLGIQNVFEGRYERIDGSRVEGVSVYEVIALKDQGLADTLRSQIAASLQAANDLPVPFDRAISFQNEQGRAKVQELIDRLVEVEGSLSAAFQRLGFSAVDNLISG